MTLHDGATGPDWVIWVVFAIFFIISLLMLTGKGSSLIAGYNTMSPEEKAKFDEKKIQKVIGIGFSIITLILFIMAVFMDVLPFVFSKIYLIILLVDIAVMIILLNTWCRK